MQHLKKAWITEHEHGLYALSLESAHAEPKHMQLNATGLEFPAVPTPERPLRHTICLKLFDRDDLIAIRDAIHASLL